ncbi:RHS repeat-associated core domain-containing protein, partial [Candidatus Parcubacteria bacterium]
SHPEWRELSLLGGIYEWHSDGTVVKYYYAGSQRVAMRRNGTLYFLLADHPSTRLRAGLGPTTLTTDAAGNQLAEMRYAPWGAVRYRSGSLLTRYTYTGQYSHVDDFGLMYYVARWYDPMLGRFVQADTLVPAQSQGTQAWDRFAYVNNNPLRYNDPDGHCILICTTIIGGAIGAIAGAVSYTIANHDQNFNRGEFFAAVGAEHWQER